MKVFLKLICVIIILVVVGGLLGVHHHVIPYSFNGEGILLIEEVSGHILYEKNAYKRLYPASTTKILTALVALDYGDLEDMVTVGHEVTLIPSDSSKAGLKEGDILSLKALIHGIMLASGNDAANAIAVYIGRKASGDASKEINQAINVFMDMMNERATMAGAIDSHFTNPHGYHDDRHYSTAYDLAMIAREAMGYPFFREIAARPSPYTDVLLAQNGLVEKEYTWMNRNAFVQPLEHAFYPYATGVKTGYTRKAGYCLVSSASRESISLIAVVLNSSEEGRWQTSKRLLEYGFYKAHESNWQSYVKAVLSLPS